MSDAPLTSRQIMWMAIGVLAFGTTLGIYARFETRGIEIRLARCVEGYAECAVDWPNFTPACPPAPDCPVDHKATMREAAICWNALERQGNSCWWGQGK